MLTSVEENYLKAIYRLSDKDGRVNTVELGKHLNVSSPTVNSMARKLASKELVEYKKYQPITITEKGKKLSLSVLRRHRLTEMFLSEKMGFTWDKVHEIAEQVEHIQSQAFFDRMEELLNFPSFDPHGSPIPAKDGKIPVRNLQPLSSGSAGTSWHLSALANTSKDFLNFLSVRNISIGSHLTIVSIEPFDESMVVQCNQKEKLTLSKKVCDALLVETHLYTGKSS